MSKRLKFFTILNIILLLILIALVIYIRFIHSPDSSKSASPLVESITPATEPTPSNDEGSSSLPPSDNSNPTSTPIPKNDNMTEETTLPTQPPIPTDKNTDPITLAFAGDVNFSEGSRTMARYDKENKGILGGFSQGLVDEMNNADIMMLNNEFPYSTRGTKTPNKSYTFRAYPKRIELLHAMGVDIVSLANNHALDYGVDALLDTFDHLESEDIDYIGAGVNMERAKEAIYYTIGDTTIAYLAASRVIFATDWYATTSRPGMIGIYDPALFIKCIEDAAKQADYVVTYLHWGVELQNYPEAYQRKMAKQFIDAGADVVIGCHPHVLQGFEFYKGKPIAYSLGNYWFNAATNNTGLLKLYLQTDGDVALQMLPAAYSNAYTSLITQDDKKKEYFDFLREISFQVTIDEDGFITDASSQ